MNCPSCNAQVAQGLAFCPECGTRMPTDPAPMRVLQGRYELIQKLGQGGMGAVYLAGDRRLSTARWAVKEMSDALITSPLERQQAIEAFKHEAELLARLSHPNLPRVTDHFTEDGKNYLVMEFVPGETLLAYVQRHGLPRPLPEVLDLARSLCDVLSYLHGQDPPIIFRDLKPANVMFTPEGQLKLIDFGIARLFKPGQARDTQAYGTMGYSAPEQYGRGQTDPRSDIYTLGVLLHQLLTGHDPASTPFRLPPANQLNPSVPAELSAALSRATDNDPDQRFANIAEFRQALFGSGGFVQLQSQAQPVMAAIGPTMPIGPGSQPFPAPSSQTYPGPGSQTYPGPSSQTYGASARDTTGLALAAFWLGVVSVAWMAVALVVVALGSVSGDPENLVSGLGALLAFPPLLLGPLAALLGMIALVSRETLTTIKGRRHAGVGVAAGVAALLLCCVVFVVFPSAPSTNTEGGVENAGAGPQAALVIGLE